MASYTLNYNYFAKNVPEPVRSPETLEESPIADGIQVD
jgi:hypothetical protein